MDKKFYYEALYKKADLASDIRSESGKGMIYWQPGGSPNEFKVFYGINKGVGAAEHEKYGVQIGSIWLPVLFVYFVKTRKDLMPNLITYPVGEAYKYFLDGVIIPNPTKQEAAEQMQANLREAKATYEQRQDVHHATFQEARIDCVTGNEHIPIVAKYNSMKPALQKEYLGQQAKPVSKAVPTIAGASKSKSRIMRKKIASRANKRGRNV